MRINTFSWGPLVLALALPMAPGCGRRAEAPSASPPSSPDTLAVFLRDWIDQHRAVNERFDFLEDTTRYLAAPFFSPDRGHRGFVVHLVGRAFCADDAAGCTTLIVATDAGAYRVIADANDTHLPISVLPDTSHGWPDVGVWVYGGGSAKAQLVRLRFDGRQYPQEAWAAPRARNAGRDILTDSTPWHQLYTPRKK